MIQTTNKIKVTKTDNGYKLTFKYSDFLYTRYSPSDTPNHFAMVDFESGGYFSVGNRCVYDLNEMVTDIYESEDKTEVIVQTISDN